MGLQSRRCPRECEADYRADALRATGAIQPCGSQGNPVVQPRATFLAGDSAFLSNGLATRPSTARGCGRSPTPAPRPPRRGCRASGPIAGQSSPAASACARASRWHRPGARAAAASAVLANGGRQTVELAQRRAQPLGLHFVQEEPGGVLVLEPFSTAARKRNRERLSGVALSSALSSAASAGGARAAAACGPGALSSATASLPSTRCTRASRTNSARDGGCRAGGWSSDCCGFGSGAAAGGAARVAVGWRGIGTRETRQRHRYRPARCASQASQPMARRAATTTSRHYGARRCARRRMHACDTPCCAQQPCGAPIRHARSPTRCPGRRRCTSCTGIAAAAACSSWRSAVSASRAPQAPERMAERDGAAVGVDARVVVGDAERARSTARPCAANASLQLDHVDLRPAPGR